MELMKKVAVVTGGGSGIGRAIAFAMLGEGMTVVICSNVKKDLDETIKLSAGLSGQLYTYNADLCDAEQVENLIAFTIEKCNRIDVLVNNAGIFVQGPFEETPLEIWDKHFDINVRAQFLLCKSAMPHMKKNGEGYIINMSSSIAMSPGVAESDRSPYFASKMAVLGLSRALIGDAKKFGIKVTNVYPDAVATPMTQDMVWENLDRNTMSWLLPQDVAEGVIFLLKTSERCFVADLYLKNWVK